tara:strand:- start:3383 stop:4570 length:1188 start_codon:yes stop_codon:yes gene_type:complete
MHLVEQYALACGAKIDKPYIYEKFAPLPFNNYITFSPFSKPAKNYDYWREVLFMLLKDLQKLGVNVIQLGLKDEKLIEGCYDMRGKLDINQTAYLIKRGILHLGADSFPTHIASSFGKKIVSLYSNSPVQNCGPFFSNPEDVSTISSLGKEEKPSYQTEESPKTINNIKPEEIACEVFKHLGVSAKVRNKTVRIGPKWINEFIETVPSAVTSFSKEVPPFRHVIRMDYHYNVEVMKEQLKVNKGIVITEKPIPLKDIAEVKSRISEIIFLITDPSYDKNFSRDLDKNNIPNSIFTKLEGEELNQLKFDILDLDKRIQVIDKKSKKLLPNYEDLDFSKLTFRSRKFIIEGESIYPGKAAYLNKVTIPNFFSSPIPIIDCPEFWEEMDFFWITENLK